MQNANENNKISVSNILLLAFVLGGLFYLINTTNKNTDALLEENIESVDNNPVETNENGKQVINLKAKVGYFPRTNTAKADTPSILRVTTAGTFDCSAALAIPTLKVSQNLPATGTTDIEIPAQKAGTTLKGTCSMGMYNFSIKFI